MTVLRDLTDIASCREVVRVQETVWGRDGEIVPASVLLVSAKRGGILIGAFDETELVGFVWSMPGVRDGAPTHWSHMLGVVPDARGRGVGPDLKLAQRDRALAAGVDLIEWTVDPLQAANAHLNITTLGGISSTYLVDAYGAMVGPLHRGTPTDRLVVEWWIRRPHVERRIARAKAPAQLIARSSEIIDAPAALELTPAGPSIPRLDLDARRVLVSIPSGFTELQQRDPERALAWRLAARESLTAYFARAYRVVDFLRRNEGGGAYLLESSKLEV